MKHILMVDDVATNLKCAAEVFRDHYKFSVEKSGEQALKFLEKSVPDLILLDINMPNMDGYEIMDKIKKNPNWCEIPVVVLTSDSDMESEIKSFRMGAMDFIRKPFDPDVMLSRIEKILEIENTKKELSILSSKDSLTGIWGRKYFEEDVVHYLETDGNGVFFLMDMDNFKEVNDLHGHIVGDDVLKCFASTLLSCVTENDVIGRMGGDEFALFLKGWYSIHEIKELANKIVNQVEKNINLVIGDEEAVSVSLGIAIAPSDATEFMALYHKADKALYYVKQNGKHGYHFFREKDEFQFGVVQESNQADVVLLQLKKMIEEKTLIPGAYRVESNVFKSIYQFVARNISRTRQSAQMLLFTLDCETDYNGNDFNVADALQKLEGCIVESLRRGDVTTRFSNMQMVVILLDANEENSRLVSERIKERFFDLKLKDIKLQCDIQEIKNESYAS